MAKYKYYLKKPRSEIIKDILYWLVTAGMICIAASSPHSGINLIRGIKRWGKYKNKRNFIDAFRRLQRRGCIKIKMVGHQIYISLTKEGKRLAGWMQIDT